MGHFCLLWPLTPGCPTLALLEEFAVQVMGLMISFSVCTVSAHC